MARTTANLLARTSRAKEQTTIHRSWAATKLSPLHLGPGPGAGALENPHDLIAIAG